MRKTTDQRCVVRGFQRRRGARLCGKHELGPAHLEGVAMKILTVSLFAALTLGGGQALAASSHQAATKTLTVAMHDPGCHWFSTHGTFTTKAAVAGPIRLRNLDEATLKVTSAQGLRRVPVGKSISLSHGKYVITMVGQAKDDNHLKLTVR
jgi:hypothetical protein